MASIRAFLRELQDLLASENNSLENIEKLRLEDSSRDQRDREDRNRQIVEILPENLFNNFNRFK